MAPLAAAPDTIVLRDAGGFTECRETSNPFVEGWIQYICGSESPPRGQTVFRAVLGTADDPHPLPSIVCATGVSIYDRNSPSEFRQRKGLCTLHVPGGRTMQAPVDLDVFTVNPVKSKSPTDVLLDAQWALCDGRDCPQPVHASNRDIARCVAEKSPAGPAYGWPTVAAACGLDGALNSSEDPGHDSPRFDMADCDLAMSSDHSPLLCKAPDTDMYTHVVPCRGGRWTPAGAHWLCESD
jgi:hypothetical protein